MLTEQDLRRKRDWAMRRVVEAIQATGNKARLVFSSTVATYGNTMDEQPPLRVNHAQNPVDIYGESKIAAERVIIESGVPYTIRPSRPSHSGAAGPARNLPLHVRPAR